MSHRIRRAISDDIPTIAEIGYEAFKVYGRPDIREHSQHIAESSWSFFYMMEDEVGPVAQAMVLPHTIQVGKCTILKADVGHVAVRPERQGEGLGSHLMEELMRLLPGEGFHCTRLGGLMKFYRRFGYEPFPRRYVQFEVQPLDAELRGVRWAEKLGLSPELQARVRPYDPHGDHAAVGELLSQYNAGRPGRLVESRGTPAPEGTAPDPLTLVYEVEGVIRGYLQGNLGPVHAGQPPTYQVIDFALDYGYPEAGEALLKTFLRQAATVAPTTVTCRLPYEERLFDLLNAATLQFDVLEMRGGFDGNMMQVLDLAGMLQAIAPELSARLQAAGCCPWEGTLGLRIPRHEATLNICADTVTAGPAVLPGSPVIEITHATVLKWVLGLCGAAEFPHLMEHLAGPQRIVLSILFPRLPAASGVWG
ncbi:MAG: GNAT family N-acetyltransferase [Armatimonadetes bacterium]|nr:GNAT family N-acetyltransferase [Armatimonadota bacterium]